MKVIKKRNILWIISLLSFALLLFGCGSDEGAQTSQNEGNGQDDSNNQVIKLTINSANQPAIEGTPSYHATIGFTERVTERTNGQIQFDIFYSNQLAGHNESLDALAKGAFDLQIGSPASWADIVPESYWVQLSFGWRGEEHLDYLIHEAGVGEIYKEALEEYGVTPLFYYHSSESVYLSSFPITSTESLKGKVMNSFGTINNELYRSFGAATASIPYAEYYEGLLRGTVDGYSFPIYSLDTYNLHEVVDYVSLPGSGAPAVGLIAMNRDTLNNLPDDLKQILIDTALEIEKETMEISKEYTDYGIRFAEEKGIEITYLDKEKYEEFLEIAMENWKLFAETNERTQKIYEIVVQSHTDLKDSDIFKAFDNRYFNN